MRTLIILRPEIFSVIIMLFLIAYDRYCSKFRKEEENYLRFALACLGHCIFALITEITVNVTTIPVWINNLCHILFFLFSLLYSLFYFEYALGLIMPKSNTKKRLMLVGYLLCVFSVIVMLVSPIEYIQGDYTRYSAGMGPTLCYMLGFILFLAADIIIIVKNKQINKAVIAVLIPLSFVTLGLLTVQIIIPEFLYTSQALTLTAVGLFLAIENPVEKFKNRAFVDYNVQLWNRNCYEYDLENIVLKKQEANHRIACIIGDVNGLKAVNDCLGHLEGDRLLENVARIWSDELKSAFKCYRIGGDEFFAFCFDVDEDRIQSEIASLKRNCKAIKLGENIPIGISVGFSQIEDNESLDEMFKRAEQKMYENKKNYYNKSGLERRTQ